MALERGRLSPKEVSNSGQSILISGCLTEKLNSKIPALLKRNPVYMHRKFGKSPWASFYLNK